jgi:dodecin
MLISRESAHAVYVRIFGGPSWCSQAGSGKRDSSTEVRVECASPVNAARLRRGVQKGNLFMAKSSHKLIHPDTTYDVVELIGTSTESWEDAAKKAIEQAAKHLRELRVAEVVDKDMVLRDGKVELYRTKIRVSFKYEGHG